MIKTLLILSAILGSLFFSAQNKDGFENMLNSELQFSVDTIWPDVLQHSNATFIDARSQEEYDVSHILNSRFIDYNNFDPTSIKDLNLDDSLIIYCSIGVRSENIGEQLKAEGFTKVYNLYGGIFSWKNQHYSIIDSDNNPTNKLHGYNKEWSTWINTEHSEVIIGARRWSDVGMKMWNELQGISNWVWSQVTFQSVVWYVNYFLLLLVASAIVFSLEILFPWRKEQAIFRKDFWLDFTYMFLNFFVFTIFLQVFFVFFWELAQMAGFNNNSFAFLNLSSLPILAQLLLFFVINDFVQWFTHWCLHRFPTLWNFHKVHHSVKEMGFAAHLRYHWMENVLYKPLKTMVVMIIVGVQEPQYAFLVHYISIFIGHMNHANINIDYKWFKYVFNNPRMHIWHHSKDLPADHPRGMNYGISLSIWDYIFGTVHIPSDGRDIELGFERDEKFPKTILGQSIYPLNKRD